MQFVVEEIAGIRARNNVLVFRLQIQILNRPLYAVLKLYLQSKAFSLYLLPSIATKTLLVLGAGIPYETTAYDLSLKTILSTASRRTELLTVRGFCFI